MSKRGPNTCYVALREVRLFSNSTQAKSGNPPPPSSLFLLRLLDSLMIVNVLTKFEKNLSTGFFFQRNDLKLRNNLVAKHFFIRYAFYFNNCMLY